MNSPSSCTTCQRPANGCKQEKRRILPASARKRALLTLAVTLVGGAALADVVGYRVAPMRAQWSAWTGRGDTISQSVTCNFDSLVSVELFVGDGTSAGNGYRVGVYEESIELTAAVGTLHKPGNWVRFEKWTDTPAFTKGRQYEFRFTCTDDAGLVYYYQSGNPYKHGLLTATNSGPAPTAHDIVMQVYGRMRPVGETGFGMCLPAFPLWSTWTHENRNTWSARLSEAGAAWATIPFDWSEIEATSGQYDFTLCDSILYYVDPGIEPVGIIVNCPTWASTAMETVMVWNSVASESVKHETTSTHCPPVNLMPKDKNANYFAHWVNTLVDRYGDRVHTWLVWNEPNDTSTRYISGVTGWWRRPTREGAYELGGGMRPLCSLYVRLCSVADSVIKIAHSRPADRVLVGNVHRVRRFDQDDKLVIEGRDWMRHCYDIAGAKADWDGVAFHAYQREGSDHRWFNPDTFAADIETLRAVMRDAGDYGELWNTEAGWQKDFANSVESRERAARNLCQTLVCTEASDASPGGVCDRSSWWFFWENNPAWGHEPLLDDSFSPRPAFYASEQITQSLTGMRFSSRSMGGDTAVDSHSRMYEFEGANGRRTWMCWENGGLGPGTVSTKLPVRTDRLVGESLAYSSRTPKFSPQVSDDGWLRIDLGERPVFITENAAPSRPDLMLDSVRYERAEGVVRAWVTNHGNRPTPRQRKASTPFPTWAILKAEGDSVAQTSRAKPIAVNQQVEFSFDISFASLPDTALVSVEVNPGQAYAELEMDNNIGYTLAVNR